MKQVRGFVADFVTDHALHRDEQARILIMLEELITNVAKYGYPNRSAGVAEVALQLDPPHLTIEFIDDGDPFDPLAAPPPDLEAPLEERDLGGLGVHILRALAEEIRYTRLEQRNVLLLRRRVTVLRS
jgi:serine/threonine-protein kinase RsbW/sigma-B regulation protein RsbU (phosphoserine phosphatase)